ncbi:MerR family transcriptional regulator [Pseudomonas sp. NPDC007930]|uniref:MerR family transcriptional regulator n=1 Tax=Pseudomonas sp. NPDC007930 TaxID=3364417 RepID=UPI0036E7A2F3
MSDLPSLAAPSGSLAAQRLFPIREVARVTGVNPVTLRAWERRYGLVRPVRTESGHRLYSQQNIDEIRAILGWLDRGVAVSKVGAVLARTAQHSAQDEALDDDHLGWRRQLRQVVARFDDAALESVYGQVFSTYPLAVAFQNILLPVWQQLHQARERLERASEWLMLDQFLRSRVLQRLQRLRGEGACVLVVALPEQCLELELLVAALLLGGHDRQVRVLAIGQPLHELAMVCEVVQPQALVLFGNGPPAADLPKRLLKLALGLPCPLLLAGATSELVAEQMAGTPIACLGASGEHAQQRLGLFLAGALDT